MNSCSSLVSFLNVIDAPGAIGRHQAGEERDRLRAEGKRLERTVLDQVHRDTDRQLTEADSKLEAEVAKLRADIERSIPALARQIASKMLNREVQ